MTDLLDAARRGRSFALLVEGPAGIGKSTVLAEAVARAGAMEVLRAQGYESEADIPYGGLLELVAPVLELREQLPPAHATALGGALALEPASPHDRFAVPVAVLGLLGLAAERSPVLVVVDDAHWLDEASLEAILFAARRIDAEGVGVLLAARDGEGERVDAPGIERLVLDGIDEDAARGLLADGEPLAPAVAEALVATSGGNPLALRELPSALSEDERAGRVALRTPLPASDEVQAAFAGRLDRLPEDTRRALCVVAAAAGLGATPITQALDDLGLGVPALTAAREAGLLDAFALRHPLLTAAAYHGRPSGERRAAHRALAAHTQGARRAHHLAEAATGPDEAVAVALDSAAQDARARGAHNEAARTSVRAADLSADPVARARRRLEAAGDLAVSGHGGRALELVGEASEATGDPQARAEIDLIRAHVLMRAGQPVPALEILEGLADRANRAGDRATAARLLVEASLAHMFTGDMVSLLDTAGRARDRAAGVSGELELLATLISGEALVALGRAGEGDALITAAEPLLMAADPVSEIAEVIGMAAMCSLWIERFARAERVVDRLIAGGREAGAAGRLGYPLCVRAQIHWRRGRWSAAYADAEEAVRLCRETQQLGTLAVALPTLARCEAALGHLDAARALGTEGLTLADAARAHATAAHSLASLGFLELTAGRAEEALVWFDRSAEIAGRQDHGEPALTMHAADRIEALARAGRREDAHDALELLAGQAQATGGAWATAAVARCRALLGADEDIERHARTALEWHARVDLPFERARTELVVGERLRRARRRADARGPLERALATFVRLGAEPWAERARTELRATGGRAAEPSEHAPVEELTPHELQVALLVAQGLTNREVGTALFLSPKTIEHHLSAIYRKLGLRSRTQLATLLSEELEPAAA